MPFHIEPAVASARWAATTLREYHAEKAANGPRFSSSVFKGNWKGLIGIRQKGRVQKGLEEIWTWDILTSFQLHTRHME